MKVEYSVGIIDLIKGKILNREFNRNVLILAGGTAIAQAVPILVSPILTRLYTPGDFGAFAVFTSITSIVSVIACGRYELAIMLPEKDEDAINVAAAAFLFNVGISGLFFIFIFFFGNWLLKVLNAENLGKLIYLAPLSVFLAGTFNILNYANNRFKLYKDISKANVYRSVTGSVVQVILGGAKSEVVGLILGQILSQFISVFKLFRNIKSCLFHITLNLMRQKFSLYKKFPIYSMPGAFLDNFAANIMFLFVPFYYGAKLAGLFFFSRRLVNAPFTLIASSISQVFFREISFLLKKDIEKAKTFLLNAALKLIGISLFVNMLLLVFVYFFWNIVFGQNWTGGKIVSIMLILSFIVRFVASPLSTTIIAVNKLEYLALWQGLYLIIEILVCAISYIFNLNFHRFLLLILVAEWISYSLYLYIIYKSIKSFEMEYNNVRNSWNSK